MSEDVAQPISADDRDGWKAQWDAQGMPWRTEPEIPEERKAYLAERQAVKPDIEAGIYPFRDDNGSIKLTRADVEWLIVNAGENDVQPGSPTQETVDNEEEGLDLRGADLGKIDLSFLPLHGMLGGISEDLAEERLVSTKAYAALDWVSDPRGLTWAKLEESAGYWREFEKLFEQAALHLEGAILYGTDLTHAVLNYAHLEQATLSTAKLEYAEMSNAKLEGVDLRWARMREAYLYDADLTRANLSNANLEEASLENAVLAGANLTQARFEGAAMREAHLEGVRTREQSIEPANLTGAFFDSYTDLTGAIFGTKQDGAARLADVHWSGTNLSVVQWNDIWAVGEERLRPDRDATLATARVLSAGAKAAGWWTGFLFRLMMPLLIPAIRRGSRAALLANAVRATRQLSVALRAQGLHEFADFFSFRAQVLQRQVFRLEGKVGKYLFSLFLGLISGYGYKPLRSVATYLLVILSFAAAYFALTNFAITPILPSHSSPLAWYEALVLSVSSFHGRGLFPTGLSLGDPIAILAAFEAIIGLLIEITFIATFTQRFFAR